MKPILRFLQSLKLTLALLILLVPIVAAGNLIPQQGRVPPWELLNWANSYPVLSVITGWCGLHHIYTSRWFLILFTILCLNLCIVIWDLIGRTARKARGLRRFGPDDPYDQSSYSFAEMPSPGESAPALERELLARGYRLVTGDGEIYARKGWIGIWGGTIMHIGFVVSLAGAVLNGLTRFSGYTEMGAGQYFSESVDSYLDSTSGPLFPGHHPDIEIRVDDVSERNEGNMKVIMSDVTIIDHGRTAARKTLRMNDSLPYAGMTVYQSSYTGPALIFEVRGAGVDQHFAGYVNLQSGNVQSPVFALEPTPFQARFAYSEGSNKADLEIRRSKALVFKGAISPGQAIEADGWSIALVAIKRWSGIFVVYDWGAAIVFLGFFLSVLGVAIMGIFDPREIWLKKTGVVLGWARWRNMFLEEFETIVKRSGKSKV